MKIAINFENYIITLIYIIILIIFYAVYVSYMALKCRWWQTGVRKSKSRRKLESPQDLTVYPPKKTTTNQPQTPTPQSEYCRLTGFPCVKTTFVSKWQAASSSPPTLVSPMFENLPPN